MFAAPAARLRASPPRLTAGMARRTIRHMTPPIDFLEAARALVPALAAREPATMAARQVPPETIADFHRTGILRIIQPRRFGGYQASFGVFSRIIEILAEGCASSAWVYAVLGEHQWIIACMPEQAQRRCLGRRSAGRRVVLARAEGNGPSGDRRLAAERALSILLRLPAFAMGDHRRAM